MQSALSNGDPDLEEASDHMRQLYQPCLRVTGGEHPNLLRLWHESHCIGICVSPFCFPILHSRNLRKSLRSPRIPLASPNDSGEVQLGLYNPDQDVIPAYGTRSKPQWPGSLLRHKLGVMIELKGIWELDENVISRYFNRGVIEKDIQCANGCLPFQISGPQP